MEIRLLVDMKPYSEHVAHDTNFKKSQETFSYYQSCFVLKYLMQIFLSTIVQTNWDCAIFYFCFVLGAWKE